MGTVASSAGVADLLQTLTSAGSPLASTFSSPAVQSALQNASPGDIVKLSDQALQLQETDVLFGDPGSSGSNTSDTFESSNNLFAALDASLYTAAAPASSGTPATSSTSSTPSATSVSDQLAAEQSQLQAAETAALFGTGTASSNNLLNVVG